MKFLVINERDNVAVALEKLKKGEDIPRGHKFSLSAIKKGEKIIKYGHPIGRATQGIEEGMWVHTHNLKTNLEESEDYVYRPEHVKIPKVQASDILAYKRACGKIGIRNEVWIIPTVGCVNGVARKLATEAILNLPKGIDGVYAFEHPYGCSQMSEDQENTKKILAGMMEHPNAAAVLVIGLGCENCHFDLISKYLKDGNQDRIEYMECQLVKDSHKRGQELLQKLFAFASKFVREKVPASELVIGLKCGGSDGLSGITANPLVGCFADKLISMGASAILTEIPEMFGAEKELLKRCENREIFNDLASLINDYKEYYKRHDQVIYENPSPGNKDGGITTLEEKSLGCVQKGGKSNIIDVIEYGEKVKKKGLTVLSSPGNDLVASTAMAVSGAHIIAFTTGRGTPLGSPVPTIKISTNNELYNRIRSWNDFNAGRILLGEDMDKLAEELVELVLATASGQETHSEINGFRDFSIFKTGVTL